MSRFKTTKRHPSGIRTSLLSALSEASPLSVDLDPKALCRALECSGLAVSAPFTPDAETATPAEIALAGTPLYTLTAEGWLLFARLLTEDADESWWRRLARWLLEVLLPLIVGWAGGIVTPPLAAAFCEWFSG